MATDTYSRTAVKELEQHVKHFEGSFNMLLETYMDQGDIINGVIVKLAAYPATLRKEIANAETATKMGDGQTLRKSQEAIVQALDEIIKAVNNYQQYVNKPLHDTINKLQEMDNEILSLKQPKTPLQEALDRVYLNIQKINQDIVALKAEEQAYLRPTHVKDYTTLITTIISQASSIKKKIGKDIKGECEQLILNAETLRKSIPFTDQFIQKTLSRQIYIVIVELKRLLELS